MKTDTIKNFNNYLLLSFKPNPSTQNELKKCIKKNSMQFQLVIQKEIRRFFTINQN